MVFTTARHCTLFLASWIHSIPLHLISLISALILSYRLRPGLQGSPLPSGFPNIILNVFLACVTRATMTCPSHSSSFYRPNNIKWRVKITKFLFAILSALLPVPGSCTPPPPPPPVCVPGRREQTVNRKRKEKCYTGQEGTRVEGHCPLHDRYLPNALFAVLRHITGHDLHVLATHRIQSTALTDSSLPLAYR
jgi:hypothetical protein